MWYNLAGLKGDDFVNIDKDKNIKEVNQTISKTPDTPDMVEDAAEDAALISADKMMKLFDEAFKELAK